MYSAVMWTLGKSIEASEGKLVSRLSTDSCNLVEKLKECLLKSMMNLALDPVTPRLMTFSMQYSACNDGNKAADMVNLVKVMWNCMTKGRIKLDSSAPSIPAALMEFSSTNESSFSEFR